MNNDQSYMNNDQSYMNNDQSYMNNDQSYMNNATLMMLYRIKLELHKNLYPPPLPDPLKSNA